MGRAVCLRGIAELDCSTWSSHSSHEAVPKDTMSSTMSSQEIYGKYTMLRWKNGRDQADLGTSCSQAGQQESRAMGELHVLLDIRSAQSSQRQGRQTAWIRGSFRLEKHLQDH